MQNSISKYNAKITSENSIINIDTANDPRRITRLYLKDSIIDFFPYCECFVQDPSGELLSKFYSLEGLPMSVSLGSEDERDETNTVIRGGYFNHDFSILKSELGNTQVTKYIAGEYMFYLASLPRFNNFIKGRAFKKPISDIVDTIARDWNIKTVKTNTTNNRDDIWYQAGRTNSDFLKHLANRAYSITNTKESTFRTFINLNNELYFMSYFDLFNQSPIKELKISFDSNMLIDSDTIRQIQFNNMGFTANNVFYNTRFYKLKSNGDVVEESLTVKDKVIKQNSKDTPLIHRNMFNGVTSQHDLKIAKTTDIENIKGKKNSYFEDSNLMYQIKVVVVFDNKYVSGKTVRIKIDTDSLETSQKLSVLNGTWLIVKSEHMYAMDGTAHSTMILSKPCIEIEKEYPFKAMI